MFSPLTDWVCSLQMVTVDHSTLMLQDIHVPKPFALFSYKGPKMQSEFIQRFCIRRQTVTVSYKIQNEDSLYTDMLI